MSKLKPVPRTLEDLRKECVSQGLLKPKPDLTKPRNQLLSFIYESHKIGRSIDRASILLVGTSGVGKSSTINHLFGLQQSSKVVFAETSDVASETRTTTEYIINVNSSKYQASGLRLGLVDTPGFSDTDGSKQDACNFYSIKKFYEIYLKGSRPNLIFVLIQATDTRIQGQNSNLAKSLRCLRELKLIDSKRPNVVGVITWSTALGENKKKFTQNIQSKMKTVRETIFQFLEVNAPVVALENDVEFLDKDGDYTVLPDGTRQERNLYQACLKLFESNDDAYGQIIFNEAFRDGPKNVTIGSKVEAKNASEKPLSKDEQHFFEFFTKALEGGIADPLIQEAQQFIAKEVPDSPDSATQIQGVVGDLKKIGVETKDDLKYISTKGLNLKTDHDLTPVGEKFLKELGVKDTHVSIAESSAPLIGQGYNILNDSCVPSKIFDVKEVKTKYGLTIPSIAKIVPVNQTGTFMYNYETTQELVKGRLSHLNVSLNVDYSVFSFSSKAGFNLQADKKFSKKSQEMSYFVEERLFEVNLGNFRDPGLKLTTDFIEDVKTLPAKFDINAEANRTYFERFFNRWGHFVVTKAAGGGSVELKINSSAIKTDSKDVESIRTALTASFSSGYLDVGSSISGSDNSSLAVSGTSLLASSTVLWNGGSRELHKKDTIKDGHAMDQWRNSLTINPSMLSTEMYLEPISTLIRLADSTKYDSTYDALQKFLGGNFKVVVQKEKEAREKREKEQKEKEEKEREESNKKNETTKDPPPKKGCFPLQSWVTILRSGTEMTAQIKNLKPGDLILSYDAGKGKHVFSPFIAWLDYSLESTRFKKITLENGSQICITDDHLIFASSEKLVTKLTGELKIGESLMVQNGEASKIVSISDVEESGFGAPLTAAGTIFVDGILTSCYANLPPNGCQILGVRLSAQTIGNVGFGPLKMLRRFQNYKYKMVQNEMHPYAAYLIWVYQNILRQNLV